MAMAARLPLAAPRGGLSIWLAAAGIALLAPVPALGGPLDRALDHLAARQDPARGGLGDDAGTDPGSTTWAALAVAAAREDPGAWSAGGPSLRDAVLAAGDRPGAGENARLVVALVALGRDPRSAGGRNPLRAVLAARRADGSIGGDISTTAWGVMALTAAGLRPGSRVVAAARAALERAQRADGGWSPLGEVGASDPITTADAVQALVAAGHRPGTSPVLRRARAQLLGAQNPDGGFPAVVGGESTALTSAWVTLAIRALGERPSRPPWGSRSGGPLALITRLQEADGGVRNSSASAGTSVRATTQAALALTGRSLPFAPGPRIRTPSRAPRVVTRDPLGGGRVGRELVAWVEDDPGATGVDPAAVRLVVRGRDLTARADVTGARIALPGALVPAGPARVRLVLVDRAGNAATIRWRVVGADR